MEVALDASQGICACRRTRGRPKSCSPSLGCVRSEMLLANRVISKVFRAFGHRQSRERCCERMHVPHLCLGNTQCCPGLMCESVGGVREFANRVGRWGTSNRRCGPTQDAVRNRIGSWEDDNKSREGKGAPRGPWWTGSLLSVKPGVRPFGFRSAVLGDKRVETSRRKKVSRSCVGEKKLKKRENSKKKIDRPFRRRCWLGGRVSPLLGFGSRDRCSFGAGPWLLTGLLIAG
ncbi:hypothetical protein QBC32DRAFT_164003 [Pseudoneurospora amorphoporcata]|uniref:Uncharacterized protein n=1 Tax=Pseudoneurospora amorphoporcata TaxID=241081 RepID=A0AAN6P1N1_9PEZI|nr:hypothetical protein QBC32DRAFT_164003 [Pseudoneurospora amorphoporcata]